MFREAITFSFCIHIIFLILSEYPLLYNTSHQLRNLIAALYILNHA